VARLATAGTHRKHYLLGGPRKDWVLAVSWATVLILFLGSEDLYAKFTNPRKPLAPFGLPSEITFSALDEHFSWVCFVDYRSYGSHDAGVNYLMGRSAVLGLQNNGGNARLPRPGA
jgi:hypothetical protein